MKIIIISPTYNEIENIEPMINELEKERQALPNHQLELLYVDDNSPDGTAKLIKSFQKKHSWIKLLERPHKQGLGAAYAAGIKYAIDQLKADAFIEFDADFQHNPADIKRLVHALDQGYDYVIGSRYERGGSTPKKW